MAEGINEAGRGLNIVVVNPKNRQVIRVGHFDTFLEGKYYSIIIINKIYLCF